MDNINKHEFSEVDNVLFKSLSKYFIIAVTLMIILFVWNFNTSNPIMAIINFLEMFAALSFIYAGFSFKKISSTTGNDIAHLIIALKKLKISMIIYTCIYVFIVIIQIYIKYFFQTTN